LSWRAVFFIWAELSNVATCDLLTRIHNVFDCPTLSAKALSGDPDPGKRIVMSIFAHHFFSTDRTKNPSIKDQGLKRYFATPCPPTGKQINSAINYCAECSRSSSFFCEELLPLQQEVDPQPHPLFTTIFRYRYQMATTTTPPVSK